MLLGTAILRTLRLVGRTYAGTATTTSGAAPTTLVDTNQKSTDDDFFNGGVICFISGANANTTRTITDYDNTTRTFTFSPALANTITSGDRYEVAPANYNRAELVQAINQALDEIGDLTQHDDTLIVLADTDEYTLPTGVSRLVQVEEARQDTAPYGWVINPYWEESNGELIFRPGKAPVNEDYPLRVWYIAPHSAANVDTDDINPVIHPERLSWTAAYYAAFNRLRVVDQEDPILKDLLAACGARMGEMAARHPIRNLPRSPRLAGW